MAKKPSPPPPLTPEDFSGLLAAHRQWERTGGQEGRQAEFAGANLQGLDLTGYDLSGLNFRGANLVRVKFGDAHLEGASFQTADLREADLSGVRGLLAPQLAGADLAGAKLPEGFKDFAAVKHVDAASSHVQKIFFVLLLVCVYCWLTIAVTTDAGLLNNFAETPLPIIGTKINLVMFYWAAPFLLLCVYLYFQLCLQRLWEALAQLPAVFPDGLPLPQRVHPWLWNGLVWAYFPRLRDRPPLLLMLQEILANFLVWWAAPLTILAMWFRYLPAHDWKITIFHLVLLSLALGGALGFSLLTRATLRLKEKRPSHRKKLWRALNLMALLLGIAVLFGIMSLFAIVGLGGPPAVTAYLRGAEVSLKPTQWKPGDLDLVRGAFLQRRDLRYAWAFKAFLVKADLFRANLENADLVWANLHEAHLEYANLQGANLEWANLHGAHLAFANLQRAWRLDRDQIMAARLWMLAKYSEEMLHILGLPSNHNQNLDNKDLSHYQISGADFSGMNFYKFILRGANLKNANLQYAYMAWADLTMADLQGTNLKAADLEEATLRGVNLKGADLRGAKGLTRDQLRAAIMDENTKLPDEFKDLVPKSKTKNK